MLSKQRNSLTMSILSRLKDKGVPDSQPLSGGAPMGGWDEGEEDDTIDPQGSMVQSAPSAKKLLQNKKKKPEDNVEET